MELKRKEIEAERLVFESSEQIAIEGSLPTPDGRAVSGVIAKNARVIVTEAAADKDAVRIAGRIMVNAVVTDGEGALFAYESGADFAHTAEAEGVTPGMRAEVLTCVQTLELAPEESASRLSAGIDLDIRVVSSAPIAAFAGISGCGDVEMKSGSYSAARVKKLGSVKLRLREELAAEGAAEVVYAEGVVSVRDISPDGGGSFVSGVISVSAITLDGSGQPSQLMRQIPFREHIAIDAMGAEAFCEANLESIYLRALGEEFDLLSMEAEVSFTVSAVEKRQLEAPMDAFSPSLGFECICEEVKLVSSGASYTEQIALKENVTLPESAPEPDFPVYVGVRPIVTEIGAEEDRSVSGVLVTDIVYMSAAGRLTSVTQDVSFTAVPTGMKLDNGSEVRASCLASAAGMSERGFQIQYNLKLTAEEKRVTECRIAVGVAEREPEKRPSGITLLFASEGEDAYDAAKRLGVSSESIRRLNPEASEPYREGERIIALR